MPQMSQNSIVIGIDTSAYTTSIAAVDQDGHVLLDWKRILDVPLGTRGLRQSEARTLHQQNLMEMKIRLPDAIPLQQVGAVAVSDKPRPVEGSYMPVFMDGVNFAAKLANQLNVPLFYFSHQEGHIEAIRHYEAPGKSDRFLCLHLSGGTSELLLVQEGLVKIVGGTKDLSFGQLIDRVGVSLGMAFPAGQEMDRLAYGRSTESTWLKPIPVVGLEFNLSGIETQCQRRIQEGVPAEELIPELFSRISKCLCKVAEAACRKYGVRELLMVGGVSASMTVRDNLKRCMRCATPLFGDFSSDNAVGIALLGGRKLWP